MQLNGRATNNPGKWGNWHTLAPIFAFINLWQPVISKVFQSFVTVCLLIMNGYLLPELLLVWSLQTMKRSRHIQAADLSQASWGNNQTQDLVSDCGYQRQGRLVDLQTAVPWQDKCPTTTERARHSSRQGKGSIRPDLPNLPTYLPPPGGHTHKHNIRHTHTHLHINTITQKRTKGQTHLQVFRCFWWTPRLLNPIGTCNIWQETLHL